MGELVDLGAASWHTFSDSSCLPLLFWRELTLDVNLLRKPDAIWTCGVERNDQK